MRDHSDLIERLRHADQHSQQRVWGSRIFGEAADALSSQSLSLSEAREEIVRHARDYGELRETYDLAAADRVRLRDALAALVLNIDAGGATLGAMSDARSALENSKAGLADAPSKSPLSDLSSLRKGAEVAGIYIASKTTHGARWRELRASGVPIISTWIDEAEAGATSNWPDLWHRCVREARQATATIVYREEGEVLKGAFVEMGAALAAGRTVFAVGCDEFSVRHHMRVVPCTSLEEAIDLARAALVSGSREDGDG